MLLTAYSWLSRGGKKTTPDFWDLPIFMVQYFHCGQLQATNLTESVTEYGAGKRGKNWPCTPVHSTGPIMGLKTLCHFQGSPEKSHSIPEECVYVSWWGFGGEGDKGQWQHDPKLVSPTRLMHKNKVTRKKSSNIRERNTINK